MDRVVRSLAFAVEHHDAARSCNGDSSGVSDSGSNRCCNCRIVGESSVDVR